MSTQVHAHYAALVEELDSDPPNLGWAQTSDFRPVTDSDIATVLRAHPDLICDVVLDAEGLADALEGLPIAAGETPVEFLGRIVMTQLTHEVRRKLLEDLFDLQYEDQMGATAQSVGMEAR